jgi:single-strand DNA-binding protein
MPGSLNKVLIIGTLGRDPEARQTSSGNTVVNISLATNERYKDSSGNWTDRVEWHRVVAFGTRAETMAKYLRKGSSVYIEGNLQTREWDNKDGQKQRTTEIVMRDFQFLDSKGQSNEPTQSSHPSGIDDSDLPF